MIRPYSNEDKNKLIALLQLNVPEYFEPSEVQDFIAYLDEEVESYFVVEENQQIIGSGGINFFPEDNLARISWDIIHPEFQEKGIGKRLTQYRIDFVKENPAIDTIIVRTSQFAYQFYQKMGFELEQMEKDYWAEGFDIYLMKMEIR